MLLYSGSTYRLTTESASSGNSHTGGGGISDVDLAGLADGIFTERDVLVRDVGPGEAVYIDVQGNLSTAQCAEDAVYAPCIFEHVYFARPDSLMDGVSVYKARLRMGERLADKVKRLRPDHDIDVVIPIPDTSRTSALELANRLHESGAFESASPNWWRPNRCWLAAAWSQTSAT